MTDRSATPGLGPVAPAMPAQNLWRGIGLLLCAVSFFALSDVATKHLTERYSVTFILGLRYIVNLALLLLILRPRGLRLNRPVLSILRGLALVAGSGLIAIALRYIPVGEAVAIVYLSPFIVMVAAYPLLGERVPPVGWIAAALGFAGVVLIASPGGGLSVPGLVFALLCAVGTAAYHLLSRFLAPYESMPALVISAATVGLVAFAPTIPFSLPATMPPLFDIGALLALGVMVTFSHILFTAAYREAPATVLAPFNYLHLVFSAGLGLLVFGHMPTPLALGGIGLVVAGGVLAAVTGGRRAAVAPAEAAAEAAPADNRRD